jgi:hypothetical protein
MRTEDELAGALRAAAEHAPGEHDLLAGVAALRRRRDRRRVRALAAAAAVVALGLGLGGVVRNGGGEVDVAGTPSPSATTLGMNAGPADRLWPRAVVTVPATNPDGMRYVPITGLTGTELLLLATSPEKGVRIERYDTAAGRGRVVTEVPMKPTAVPPAVTADGENVAWMSDGRRNGVPVREIWTAPLSGGRPSRVTTVSGARADIDAIAINGDRIIWSERRGDVWSIPRAGGAAERIPAGRGLHLLRWPWAGDVPAGPDDGVRNQSRIVDLTIGFTAEVVTRPGTRGLRCWRFWCSGRDATGAFLQRTDGSGLRRLDDRGFRGQLAMAPVLDRFVVTAGGIYDIPTGRVATVEGRWTPLSAGQPTIVYWEGGAGTLRVLDLAAVPPWQ